MLQQEKSNAQALRYGMLCYPFHSILCSRNILRYTTPCVVDMDTYGLKFSEVVQASLKDAWLRLCMYNNPYLTELVPNSLQFLQNCLSLLQNCNKLLKCDATQGVVCYSNQNGCTMPLGGI